MDLRQPSDDRTIANQLVVRAYTNGQIEVGLPQRLAPALRLLEIAVQALREEVEAGRVKSHESEAQRIIAGSGPWA